MSFSERMKLVPVKQIQTDNIDSVLKHRIINLIEETFDENQAKFVLDIMGFRTISDNDVLKISISRGGRNFDKLIAALEDLPWNKLYDIIEYGYIVYDSTNERDFATDLDTNTDVAVYVKLPDSFYIATPVGHYNPDWAIAFYEGTVKHIYFVAETKGSMSSMQLRLIEESKIHCAREHFKAISNGNVVYDVVDSYRTLLERVMK